MAPLERIDLGAYRMKPASGLFARAAAGDLHSQLEMSRRAFTLSLYAAGPPALGAMEALHWMRIAEANGGRDLPVVRDSIAGLLVVMGDYAAGEGHPDTAAPFRAEALIRLRRLADEGSELATHAFNDLFATSDADVLALAMDMEGITAS